MVSRHKFLNLFVRQMSNLSNNMVSTPAARISENPMGIWLILDGLYKPTYRSKSLQNLEIIRLFAVLLYRFKQWVNSCTNTLLFNSFFLSFVKTTLFSFITNFPKIPAYSDKSGGWMANYSTNEFKGFPTDTKWWTTFLWTINYFRDSNY